MENLSAQLEALLFIYGDPLDMEKAAVILKSEINKVKKAAATLKNNLSERKSGLTLLMKNNVLQLVARPDFDGLLESIAREDLKEELSPAVLETLSVLLYSSPISKTDLEQIRGVNSSFSIRQLLIRGLIDKKSDSGGRGKILYEPSLLCLRHLGINNIEELPDYNEYQQLRQKNNSSEK